jgi:hypothetical protein
MQDSMLVVARLIPFQRVVHSRSHGSGEATLAEVVHHLEFQRDLQNRYIHHLIDESSFRFLSARNCYAAQPSEAHPQIALQAHRPLPCGSGRSKL